jgi:hypothetical protein
MNLLTYTDIANMAIDWCGGSLSIDSIDNQNNPDAIVCKRNLPMAIKSELDKFEWTFARKKQPAVPDMTEENQIFGYFCYYLPDDFSRLSNYMMFTRNGYKLPVDEYRTSPSYLVENDRLYVKFPIRTIYYTSNEVDIARWPSLFCDVVALNLAQRIVGKIKGLDADISFFESLYKQKLKDARKADMITLEAAQGGESILQLNRIVP